MNTSACSSVPSSPSPLIRDAGVLHWCQSILVFLVSAILLGAGSAGPGLTWDEPAYRYSQVRLESWGNEFAKGSLSDARDLLSADSIDFYWEFNRHGPNFHPPMASYGNLVTHAVFGRWVDDLTSRRLASALELAFVAAMLFHFVGRRYGAFAGLFASACLLATPRIVGDAHLMGTDIPMTMFWTAVALALPNALARRTWQYVLAVLCGCLFLVKFNGVAVAIPACLAFVAYAFFHLTFRSSLWWTFWTVAIVVPLGPVAVTLLWGASQSAPTPWMQSVADWGMNNTILTVLLCLWPLVALSVHALTNKPAKWPVGLETPWVVVAVAPVVAIALNPTWWHDPVRSLSSYFELNLARKGHLPDIEIFYLGKQYVYSLPWHNAWVLMAVTIPFGILALGIIGAGVAIARCWRDAIPLYLLANAVTLPVLRMFPVPAHDGVRLFLPTFVFFAALAGIAAAAIAKRWPSWPVRIALVLFGPVWGAVEVARIHPLELSYYNIGLEKAQRLGFEPTYWYDAVTPTVLRDLNERLPKGAAVGLPSESAPPVFVELQSQGKLRGDLILDLAEAGRLPYMLLLTHSSKATPFTRLLFAVEPWYSSGFDGVRLFSVVAPEQVALAWALHALVRELDQTTATTPGRDILEEMGARLRRAAELATRHGASVEAHLRGEPDNVARLARQWAASKTAMLAPKALLADPKLIDTAVEIVRTRGEDIAKILKADGYLAEPEFGGYLKPSAGKE